MINIENLTNQQLKEKFRIKSPWDLIILFVLNVLITIPLFIIAHQNIIDFNWKFHLDRILLFLLILLVFQLILKAMRRITLIAVILYFIALIYGSVFGDYGFGSVFEDYRSMMYAMDESPYPQDIIINKLLPFPNKFKIIDAIEYSNPKVRNFAIMATSKHFK